MKSHPISPAQQIALWADKLRDISASGLHFADNPYERANYRAVQEIAMAMMALATNLPVEAMEPLRSSLFARPTPIIVGDGAVIDEAGRILLIRRADNGRWAMPGGMLEVGETPAEGIVREVLEETGVHAQAVALAGIFDSRLCGTPSAHHLYHLVFLCRPLRDKPDESPTHPNETAGMGWFTEAELPNDLARGHAVRIPYAFRVWRGEAWPYFDGLQEG